MKIMPVLTLKTGICSYSFKQKLYILQTHACTRAACLLQLQNYSLLKMRHDRETMLALTRAVFSFSLLTLCFVDTHTELICNKVFPVHLMPVAQALLPDLSPCRHADSLQAAVWLPWGGNLESTWFSNVTLWESLLFDCCSSMRMWHGHLQFE